ncbi:hypothetical protein WOLCODRAFT_136951 [Wolfiporia cocos MD-104 SS10]|uniref:Uncharacterized protein n=1 Tax=Wolfiporia cocos (strain MD-104) TaxID=742152 RepID=A0A2H3JSF3_WOLCO|nr:hypothetical protein WOLCODRAFT_136951 [Wolfiporia cocos MD-104 SS10]
MPAPAVYVLGAVGAIGAMYVFGKFVYEPHIAPHLEVWAESFLEHRRRARRQRQGPILASPVETRHDDDSRDDNDSSDGENGLSVELDEFTQGSSTGRLPQNQPTSGLRFRPRTGIMDQSNIDLPFNLMSPTHVVFDSSEISSPAPSSVGSPQRDSPVPTPAMRFSSSIREDRLSSSAQRTRSPAVDSPIVVSPRLPTPMSMSAESMRAGTPDTLRSFPSSRSSSPDIPAMYDTAIMGSVHHLSGEQAGIRHLMSDSRVQSPFSDIYSVSAGGSTSSALAGGGQRSPMMYDTDLDTDFELPSDTDDNMSLRSAMFSPGSGSAREEHAYEVGSEASSWASVGRRTPEL